MLRCAVLLLVTGVGLSAASLFGRTQSFAVSGKLMCGSEPASGVFVKIVDIDTGGPDDELDSGETDSQGRFSLSGSTSELTSIDPRIKIYHDCNDHGIPCQRKWDITIPDHYITRGKRPGKTFNLGEVNLEVELDDEEHDCFH